MKNQYVRYSEAMKILLDIDNKEDQYGKMYRRLLKHKSIEPYLVQQCILLKDKSLYVVFLPMNKQINIPQRFNVVIPKNEWALDCYSEYGALERTLTADDF